VLSLQGLHLRGKRVENGNVNGHLLRKVSFPRTQRDRAIRLMSQSANGEIRPVSLRSQLCTFSGASEGGLRSADRRDWKLPTQIISAVSRRHSFAPFRKNSIVTGVVPLFRHAWRVPFCTTGVSKASRTSALLFSCFVRLMELFLSSKTVPRCLSES